MLTLQQVADNQLLMTETFITADDERFLLRPLMHNDVIRLTTFLQSLSDETKRFSSFDSYDERYAREVCDAIARYDKLRLVLISPTEDIASLLEFSFDLVEDDLRRYASYGIPLATETDCRFGITITDEFQGRGLGSLTIPKMLDIAKQFGQERVILWGGVLADNHRAIHVYQKCGFKRVGTFVNADAIKIVDMICDNLKL